MRPESPLNEPYNALARENLADCYAWFPDTPERSFEWHVVHFTLGMAGEVGEVVELVKKWQGGRPGYDIADPEIRGRIAEEICDVLMCAGDLAAFLELDIDSAMSLKRANNAVRFGGGS